MILKEISTEEAFKLLMKAGTENKVFVKTKNSTDYGMAEDYRYGFGLTDRCIDIRKAKFYLEEKNE